MIAGGNTLPISLDELMGQEAFAGGKATNLAILKHNGFPVPKGLVLPFSMYEAYLTTGEVEDETVKQIVDNLNSDTLAVRSSANVEDSLRASFAGQFTTELNVKRRAEDIKKSILTCFSDAQAYNQNYYTEALGQDVNSLNQFRMALLIQEMVEDPPVSGVIFTTDPMLGLEDTLVINCTSGLGESLVSGEVSGEVYHVNKENLVCQTGNGTLLSDSQVKELTITARRIEDLFGCSQDIEFSYTKDDKLKILQARPITSFSYQGNSILEKERKKIKEVSAKENELFGMETIFSNSNIVENFPDPTPMGIGIFNYIFIGQENFPGAIQIGRNDLGYSCGEETYNNKLFQLIAGKPYADLIVDALTFRIKGVELDDYLSGFVSGYLSEIREDPKKGNYPEGGLYVQHPSLDSLVERFGKEKGSSYFKAYEEFHQGIKDQEESFHDTFQKVLMLETDQYYRSELETDFSELSKEELAIKFEEYLEQLRLVECTNFVKIARFAFFGYDRLRDSLSHLREEFGSDFIREAIDPITNTSAMTDEQVFSHSLDLLLQAKPDHIINETQNLGIALDDLSSCRIDVDEFLEKYGHVGQLDISLPRYVEEKDYFSDLAQKVSPTTVTTNPQQGHKALELLVKKIEERGESTVELIHNAEMANIYMPLRETAKMSYFKIHYLAKKALVALSEKTDLKGNEIYMLFPNEVELLVKSPTKAFQLIKQRECLNEAYDEMALPNLIYSGDDLKREEFDAANGNGLTLTGETVRSGRGEGKVLLARTNIELAKKYNQYVEDGIDNIVGVFPAMDPSYATRNRFVGLVTKYGGPLAHAAIIARDQKIPYITGVNIDKILDGSRVFVDGSSGKIHIMEEEK